MAKATIAFIVLLLAVNTYCDVFSRISNDVQEEELADPISYQVIQGCQDDRWTCPNFKKLGYKCGGEEGMTQWCPDTCGEGSCKRPCSPNPCKNGGTCIEISYEANTHKCTCAKGYKLPNCVDNVCKPNPCKAKQSCTPLADDTADGTFQCKNPGLTWHHDGQFKSYSDMELSCYRKSQRLCYYKELCPNGRGNPPYGGAPTNKFMWSPIRMSNKDHSPNWAQVGINQITEDNKEFDIKYCDLMSILTRFGPVNEAGSWMVSRRSMWDRKNIYPCCGFVEYKGPTCYDNWGGCKRIIGKYGKGGFCSSQKYKKDCKFSCGLCGGKKTKAGVKVVAGGISYICRAPCENGHCDATDHCKCKTGWKGKQCKKAICKTPCEHGWCTGPELCYCKQGWQGSHCETPSCENTREGCAEWKKKSPTDCTRLDYMKLHCKKTCGFCKPQDICTFRAKNTWEKTKWCKSTWAKKHCSKTSCGPKPKPKPNVAIQVIAPAVKCKDISPSCQHMTSFTTCNKPGVIQNRCQAYCGLCNDAVKKAPAVKKAGPKKAPCKDKNKDCGKYKLRGMDYCGIDYMKKNCEKTCKTCKEPCEDRGRGCAKWKELRPNGCTNVMAMNRLCKKTCGYCNPPTVPRTAHKEVRSGSCTSVSEDICRKLSKIQDPDAAMSQIHAARHPPGCYWKPSNGVIWYNTKASTVKCSDDKICICDAAVKKAAPTLAVNCKDIWNSNSCQGWKPCQSWLRKVCKKSCGLCPTPPPPTKPPPGMWSTWGGYGTCSKTCRGRQTRPRFCDRPRPGYGGSPCVGSPTDSRVCGKKCPVNGKWGDWSDWGACSKVCGEGERTATRLCDKPFPMNGGKECEGPASKVKVCKLKECTDACVQVDVDFGGNDVSWIKIKLHVESWKDCSDYCRKTPACKVWTYKTTGDRECFAKRSNSGRQSLVGVMSGSRSCGQTGGYVNIGCYEDKASRAILGQVTIYHADAIRKCFERAVAEGNEYFAVQYNVQCFTSPDAGATYNKYGKIGGCKNGRGGGYRNDVYKVTSGLGYVNIGCYKDARSRAILGQITDYAAHLAIRKCFERAAAEGNEYFAVQYNVQCFTGPGAGATYNKYGKGGGCVNGRGGGYRNSVYKVTSGRPCPEISVDYPGNDLAKRGGVASWIACDALCKNTEDCSGWTYATQGFIWARKFCFLKRGNYLPIRNPSLVPNLISGSRACAAARPVWYSDGDGKSYNNMKSMCEYKGQRLCNYGEVCPLGWNKPPVGGLQANGDMWSPIVDNWIQVGTRVGGICNLLTTIHPINLPNYWMITQQKTPWKRIYPCCA